MMSVPYILLRAAVLLWLSAATAAAPAELPDGERALVQQLMQRGFFELAEQYCLQRLEDRVNVNNRAEWELVLSECHEQHAWEMASDSRVEMVRLAAHRITEFLKNNTPSPEEDLILRVRQIEILASIASMETVIRASASEFGRTSSSFGQSQETGKSAGSGFALEAIRQSSELGVALLSQLDQLRSAIDRDIARTARERIRCALAEMTFAQSRLTQESDSEVLRSKADEMAEQLLKSASDDRLRFRARLLLADIQLDQRDFSAFQLRLTSLLSAADTDAKRTAAQAVRIRGLLIQGQPSEALQECLNQAKTGVLPTQELRTLQLQGLLQMLELLSQLPSELPKTAVLKLETIQEFARQRDAALDMTRGVWRERCLKIATRFERVQQVGPEAASDLEAVSALAESQNISAARDALLKLASRTTPPSPEITANFLLQAGDFAVRMGDWRAAIDDLSRSRELFRQSGNIEREAAADLLRIFALGQEWDSAGKSPALENNYRTAIETHLQLYSDQTTVSRVREWQVRLLRMSNPLQAAEDLLDLSQSANALEDDEIHVSREVAQGQQMNLLCQAGDCLLDAIHAPPAKIAEEGFMSRMQAMCRRFSEQSQEADTAAPESDPRNRSVLKVQRLCVSLDAEFPAADWKKLQSDSRSMLQELGAMLDQMKNETGLPDAKTGNSPNAELNGLLSRALAACHELHFLSSVRQLAAADTFVSSQTAIEAQGTAERLRSALFLVRYLPDGTTMPGDQQIASLLIRLLEVPAQKSRTSLTFEQQIESVEILKLACDVTGQHDVFERRLNEMLAAELSEVHLGRLAAIVSATDSVAPPTDSGLVRRFWQSVHNRSRAGESAWFEASLQMALDAAASGDRMEASRILAVVSVLYPDWGSPARKTRAKELQERLENGQ